MNDSRIKPGGYDPDGDNMAVLQWRVAVLEADQLKQEAEHKAKQKELEAQIKALGDKQDAGERKYDNLINKGLGIGLALSFLGMVAGFLLSFFKSKLGIG